MSKIVHTFYFSFLAILCPPLPQIQHGSIFQDTSDGLANNYDSVAEYTCELGKDLCIFCLWFLLKMIIIIFVWIMKNHFSPFNKNVVKYGYVTHVLVVSKWRK
jgi:hypothetical protein